MADTITLTPAQIAALAAVSYRWQSAEDIGSPAATLASLVRRGLVERRTFMGTTRRDQPASYRITTAGVRESNTARRAAKAAAAQS